MSDRKPKVIKREIVERQTEEERRTELAMLKLLAKKYPDEAKRFVNSVKSKFSLTNSFV
jgi:hypothetical protein